MGLLVAACEEGLLGQRLVDWALKAQLFVDPQFYQGELVSMDEAIKALRRASMGNIVGNALVERAVEEGLISPEGVLSISGVKVAMFLALREEP